MGKSVTATLTGVLVQQGFFGLDDPAPVPEWQAAGSPRVRITLSRCPRAFSRRRWSGRAGHGVRQ